MPSRDTIYEKIPELFICLIEQSQTDFRIIIPYIGALMTDPPIHNIPLPIGYYGKSYMAVVGQAKNAKRFRASIDSVVNSLIKSKSDAVTFTDVGNAMIVKGYEIYIVEKSIY